MVPMITNLDHWRTRHPYCRADLQDMHVQRLASQQVCCHIPATTDLRDAWPRGCKKRTGVPQRAIMC